MIVGGYYIKARKIQDSEIAFAPPHVREIWDWLIKEANHRDVKDIKRGSTVRSLRDIQEGLKWYVGYRKEMYSKSKCEMAMNWLRKRGMITTTKTTRGMVVTICNYDDYQDPKNYETNNEEAHETNKKRTATRHYKQECKELIKNEKKKEGIKKIMPPTQEEVIKYFDENGYTSESAIKAFKYYDIAQWHDSKGNRVRNWKQKMQSVWFKDENRQATTTTWKVLTPQDKIR